MATKQCAAVALDGSDVSEAALNCKYTSIAFVHYCADCNCSVVGRNVSVCYCTVFCV